MLVILLYSSSVNAQLVVLSMLLCMTTAASSTVSIKHSQFLYYYCMGKHARGPLCLQIISEALDHEEH